MRIVHIAPNAPYNDYWGYQENLLPKYHKKMGHDVSLIITNTTYKNGKIVETNCGDYVLDDGVRVIRLKAKQYPHHVLTNLTAKLPVMQYLEQIRPDFVFFHGLISTTIFDVIKYKKRINPQCIIVQDNHLDYYNGSAAANWKQKFFRAYYRVLSRQTIGYVDKVYGVTPWRKTYAQDYFRIPPKKTDVLIMGADDDKIDFFQREALRTEIRQKNQIGPGDFFVVSGGKIDEAKNIHTLMEATKGMDDVKLLIFGQVHEEMKSVFDRLLRENENIRYIGWIDADKVYDYFLAADLIVFPGTHSVIWEQACACKVPCVFKRWKGMDHVNNGGNSDFLEDISVASIRERLLELKFTEKYAKMLQAARSEKTDIYLYSRIAEKSLECVIAHESF